VLEEGGKIYRSRQLLNTMVGSSKVVRSGRMSHREDHWDKCTAVAVAREAKVVAQRRGRRRNPSREMAFESLAWRRVQRTIYEQGISKRICRSNVEKVKRQTAGTSLSLHSDALKSTTHVGGHLGSFDEVVHHSSLSLGCPEHFNINNCECRLCIAVDDLRRWI
jgi:hypothetical protein